MKMNKFLVLLVLVALFVTSCAPAATATLAPTVAPTTAPKPTTAPTVAPTVAPTAKPTVAPTLAPIELRMAWYDDGNEGKVMRELLDRFEKENTGIKVVMDTIAYKDIHTTLQGQVETGKPPDLARVTELARFASYYLDMRQYLTDAAAWEKNWAPEFLQAIRPAGDTKSLNGFPTQFTVSGPFVNRTLFAQANVPVPSDSKEKVTWDEWIAAAKKVADATKTPYAVAIDRSGHRFWGPAMSMCANFVESMSAKKFTIDTPGFRKATQMLIDWHKNKLTAPEIWAGGGGGYAAGNELFVNGKLVFYFSGSWQVKTSLLFVNGKLVFYFSGSWQVGQFATNIGNKFEWDVVPNPYGDCGSTGMPGGAALVSFKGTKYPKEVTKLVEYLTREDILGEFSSKSLFIPGHLGLAKKGITFPSSNKQLNTFLKEIPKLLPQAYSMQYHPLTATINVEMRDRLSQVITGELTLDEAIKRIQQKMDEATAAMK